MIGRLESFIAPGSAIFMSFRAKSNELFITRRKKFTNLYKNYLLIRSYLKKSSSEKVIQRLTSHLPSDVRHDQKASRQIQLDLEEWLRDEAGLGEVDLL